MSQVPWAAISCGYRPSVAFSDRAHPSAGPQRVWQADGENREINTFSAKLHDWQKGALIYLHDGVALEETEHLQKLEPIVTRYDLLSKTEIHLKVKDRSFSLSVSKESFSLLAYFPESLNILSCLRMLSVRIGCQTMWLHVIKVETHEWRQNDVDRPGGRLWEAMIMMFACRGNTWPGHHSSLHHFALLRFIPLLHFCFILLWLLRPVLVCFISIWISCPVHTFHSLLCSVPSSRPIRALSVFCVSGTPLPLWTHSTHALSSNKQLAKPALAMFAFAKDRWNQLWMKPI